MTEFLWRMLIIAMLAAILYLCLCIHTNLKWIGEKVSTILNKKDDR